MTMSNLIAEAKALLAKLEAAPTDDPLWWDLQEAATQIGEWALAAGDVNGDLGIADWGD